MFVAALCYSVCVGKLIKMDHLTMPRVGARERNLKVEIKQPISRPGGCDAASGGADADGVKYFASACFASLLAAVRE